MSSIKHENGQVLIPVAVLTRLVTRSFENAGCAPEEAAQVAHYMVDGNLTGHDSHGVIRTGRYISWMGNRVYPGRRLSVLSDSGNLVIADGNYGFGQIVTKEATRIGIDKAKEHGMAVVALRHSGHLGRVGTWAEMAAAENVVFIAFVNVRASLLVAPFGGVDRRMSTAPFCVGVPVAGGDSIILDFATSAVAEGKALVALQGGKELPPDVLITPDGQRTNDPTVLYGDVPPGKVANPMEGPGALRALGDHKGSGLAFICEIMACALTGAGCSGDNDRPYCNNMLGIFMDAGAFHTDDTLAREVKDYVKFYTSSKPETEGGRIMVPGEPERLKRAERTANGIPMAEKAWNILLDTARQVGISEDEIESILNG